MPSCVHFNQFVVPALYEGVQATGLLLSTGQSLAMKNYIKLLTFLSFVFIPTCQYMSALTVTVRITSNEPPIVELHSKFKKSLC